MPTPPEFSGIHTRAVHAGARPDPNTGSRATPIHQTTSYVFEDSEAAAAYFNLQVRQHLQPNHESNRGSL